MKPQALCLHAFGAVLSAYGAMDDLYVIVGRQNNRPGDRFAPMATTFSNLLYHVVFSTKYRQPSIHSEIREPLYEYVGGILRAEGAILLEIGGMPDHVHLLLKSKTDVAVSLVVQKVKAKSSKWLNERQGSSERFQWQTGYGIFSVSASLAERVRTYIRTQEEHHQKVSFRDELARLLERNGIPYDERYLLDENPRGPAEEVPAGTRA